MSELFAGQDRSRGVIAAVSVSPRAAGRHTELAVASRRPTGNEGRE